MDFEKALTEYRKEPDDKNLEKLAGELLKEMTLKEKLRALRGRSMGATLKGLVAKGRFYNYKPYPAGGCKRLGIPPVLFTDGPRGVVVGESVCFPVSMLRGATFDDGLEYRVGEVFAREAVAGGANLFAGVCINLLRNPMWGRAQETYGEDPCLLGKMGAALTRAARDNGVIACPKHFALNSIEDLRFSVDARADERTLREVYLPHFKKCLDAGAMSIMGAYNKVNGEYCCENGRLLTDILRNEWGFKGFALSDFFYGIHDAAKSIKAGLDVEMPYRYRYALLGIKLKKGEISEEDINSSVLRVLRALIKTLSVQKKYPKSVILSKEHINLAREVAAKGIVLLKNDGAVLPIPEGKTVAVVGRYADRKNVGDRGSSNVFSPYTVTPYRGIKNRFGDENVVLYNGRNIKKAVAAASKSEYVVACVGCDGRLEGEFLVNLGGVKKKPGGLGGDRADLKLPEKDVALIKALAKLQKKLIVDIIGGSAFVITEWVDEADAVLDSFYGGLEGGNALADVISGDVNPGGKLPFTMAKSEDDYPPFLHIGDGKKEIDYGYYHGYSLLDKKNVEPLYPFGYGLSYTSFEISGARSERVGDAAVVSADVTNTGDFDGDEVVQVYVSSLGGGRDRPVKLLKGFKRVSVKKGGRERVEIKFDVSDIKFYNPDAKEWELDDAYAAYIGSSSGKLKKAGELSFN